MSAETIASIGASIATGASAIIAVVAAGITGKQLSVARRAREDVLQPYVFVDFSISDRDTQVLLWTVRNTGASIAHNVSITFDPPLQGENQALPTVEEWKISALAPGARIRHYLARGFIFFDREDWPKQTQVTVNAGGLDGPMQPLTYTADLEPLGQELADQYPQKRIADKTEKMAKALEKLAVEVTAIRRHLAGPDD